MNDLNITSNSSAGVLELVLEGSLNEAAKFDSIDMSSINEIFIDFNAVTFINSTGINKWVAWMNELESSYREAQISFCNCPKIIVDQLNAVKGFLPLNARVESFWLPFYCEDSDRREFMLMTREKEFKEESTEGPEWVNIPECNCSQSNTPCDPDIMPTKYFAFMKKRTA